MDTLFRSEVTCKGKYGVASTDKLGGYSHLHDICIFFVWVCVCVCNTTKQQQDDFPKSQEIHKINILQTCDKQMTFYKQVRSYNTDTSVLPVWFSEAQLVRSRTMNLSIGCIDLLHSSPARK